MQNFDYAPCDKQIHIKISEKDLQKIRDRMKQTKIINMSAYIRKMALNGYIVNLDLSDMKEVSRLLHINSNNLNQYAKQANINGSIYYEDIQNLKRQHEELIELMRGIYHQLSSIR